MLSSGSGGLGEEGVSYGVGVMRSLETQVSGDSKEMEWSIV